jgi:hypothetical protein
VIDISGRDEMHFRVRNTCESVEKVGFPEEQGKLGDGKCLGEARRSFVGLPGVIQFLRISSD